MIRALSAATMIVFDASLSIYAAKYVQEWYLRSSRPSHDPSNAIPLRRTLNCEGRRKSI